MFVDFKIFDCKIFWLNKSVFMIYENDQISFCLLKKEMVERK